MGEGRGHLADLSYNGSRGYHILSGRNILTSQKLNSAPNLSSIALTSPNYKLSNILRRHTAPSPPPPPPRLIRICMCILSYEFIPSWANWNVMVGLHSDSAYTQTLENHSRKVDVTINKSYRFASIENITRKDSYCPTSILNITHDEYLKHV